MKPDKRKQILLAFGVPEGAPEAVLAIRLTPKAAKEAVGELVTQPDGSAQLRVGVHAAPEDNKANAALCALLAEAFGVTKSQVMLVAGAKSRHKRVKIIF